MVPMQFPNDDSEVLYDSLTKEQLLNWLDKQVSVSDTRFAVQGPLFYNELHDFFSIQVFGHYDGANTCGSTHFMPNDIKSAREVKGTILDIVLKEPRNEIVKGSKVLPWVV